MWEIRVIREETAAIPEEQAAEAQEAAAAEIPEAETATIQAGTAVREDQAATVPAAAVTRAAQAIRAADHLVQAETEQAQIPEELPEMAAAPGTPGAAAPAVVQAAVPEDQAAVPAAAPEDLAADLAVLVLEALAAETDHIQKEPMLPAYEQYPAISISHPA